MTQEEYNQDDNHEEVEPEGEPEPVEEVDEETSVAVDAPEPSTEAEGMVHAPDLPNGPSATLNEPESNTEQESAPSEE